MNKAFLAAATALALALPAVAQDAAPSSSAAVGQTKTPAPAPSEIVAAAPKSDWKAIPAEDLLVMTLAPDAEGKPRQVVIQLMPAPFSQGWVHNIRLFARAGWYDGISVNRVQDNYVTQWGDPNYDNPEATGKPKPLPQGLKVMTEAEYTASTIDVTLAFNGEAISDQSRAEYADMDWSHNTDAAFHNAAPDVKSTQTDRTFAGWHQRDSYAEWVEVLMGWPLASEGQSADAPWWPTHCYGMVGVGRNYSPDTGSGAELYTVIGHAPRHLDRDIALVGRVIEGMEHLSSLPRGKGALGFYAEFEKDKRTPILTVRVASDLPDAPASSSEAEGQQTRPKFEYLSTESATFARYAEAIANRRDPFFITPAGGADICNIRVPVRRVTK